MDEYKCCTSVKSKILKILPNKNEHEIINKTVTNNTDRRSIVSTIQFMITQ